MKKLVKLMAVAVLTASSVGAIMTLEMYDTILPFSKNPAHKQMLICEREAGFLLKDPMLCVRAAQISLKEYDSMPAGYSSYQEYATAMYKNASLIYNKIGDHSNEIKMFKKVLEFSPNDSYVNTNLGLAYALGKGVETNKIKAYEHWSIAAKQGGQEAQNNLDMLCKQSPWACK